MDVKYSSPPSVAKTEGTLQPSANRHAFWRAVWAEVKMIWQIAAPAILTSIFQYSLAFGSQTLIGHLGTTELAAFGTYNLVVGGIGLGVMMGMGSALETLCGQAYGAGKLDMLGIYLQRSWVILSLTGLLLTLVYVFSSYLLKLMGQSADIADLAGKLSIWMIPQLFAYALNFPIQKFLQAQTKVIVMLWISFGILVIHLFISWLCIIKLGMGLGGAALTLNISWWLMVFAQLIYVISGRFKQSWTGFSWLAFADLYAFVKLSFASGVMICIEYWSVMVLIIMVGFLKNPETEIAAVSICLNVESWLFMIPIGFTAAISVRVSNELGAGNARAAKFSVMVMVAMSFVTQTTLAIILFLTRNSYPSLFTNDKSVMDEVSRISLFMCGALVLCSVQPILSGVAVGAGWQAIIAYINIGCYYLVGIPLSAVLGFKLHYGLEGLWGGSLIGVVLQTILVIVITWRTDWRNEVNLAKERLSTWGSQVGSRSSE